jgi:hypothetical protein
VFAVRLPAVPETQLELSTPRSGSWTRALQRVAFDNLLVQLSGSVMEPGGSLMIGVSRYGRLNATVRVTAGPD